jgi:hypothetical protein
VGQKPLLGAGEERTLRARKRTHEKHALPVVLLLVVHLLHEEAREVHGGRALRWAALNGLHGKGQVHGGVVAKGGVHGVVLVHARAQHGQHGLDRLAVVVDSLQRQAAGAAAGQRGL